MTQESKESSAPRKRADPFKRPDGTAGFAFETSGRSAPAGVQRSMDSLLRQIGIARPAPGGNDDVEDPLLDSWAVAACVDAWTRAVRGVPMRIWESASDDANEVPEGHPLRKLFSSPVSFMGSADLLEACVANYIDSGEDWLFLMGEDSKPLTSDPNPQAKIPLPRWMLPVSGRIVSDERRSLDNRIVSVTYGGGTQVLKFPLGSTVQHRRYNHTDPQRGLSPLDAAMRAISVGFQAERYQEGVMRAGGPGAYVKFKDPMDPADERRVQEEANENLRDPDVLGGVKVLSGDVEVIPNPATPKDMLPAETLAYSRNVVCSSLGVPPPVIGVFDDATYNNITEAYRQFWSNVQSWLESWATKINEFLLSRLTDSKLAACRISFDLSGVQALQKDNTAKFKLAAEVATSGVPVSYAEMLIAQGVEAELGKDAETIVQPVGFSVFDPKAGEKAEAAAAAAGGVAVQDTGLNGAQITGITDGILLAVSEERLTVDGAIALLLAAFPNLDQAEASRIANGAIVKPPEPDPAPGGGSGAPAAEDAEDPAEDAPEGKSMPAAAPRALPPLNSEDDRAAYHGRLVERVMAKPERSLAVEAEAWLARYEAAQLALVEDFAEHGPGTRSVEGVTRDIGMSDEIEQFLLLIDERWKLELAALSRGPLEAAYLGALEDIASELSVVQISATDPRVAQSLAQQEIQLSEGVTSRLAQTVKETILESLANPGGNAAAPLQLQIRDRLPELTENLRRVFGTKEARAATIARTETSAAVSDARELQMDDAGIQEVQWIARPDDVVRESHRELDGQVRSRGEEFKPGLRRPHDPDAAPGEVINCRCTTKAIIP